MKLKLFPLLAIGLMSVATGMTLTAVETSNYAENNQIVLAEEETPVYDCYVTIGEAKNGSISVDKTEGNVGDLVTVNVQHDLFYLIDTVSVNGTALIESETTDGLYTFALVEGENLLVASFVVDQELLGDLSTIYEQAKNKDWTNLFTMDNVIRVISWLLEGGILIAIVRYYIKDKKLEKKVEDATKASINKIIPETTKQTVIESVNAVTTPIIKNFELEVSELKNAMGVFAECFALSQEGTPESKIAIIDSLKNLNLGNNITIENVEKYVKDLKERAEKAYNDAMEALSKISDNNQNIIDVNENKEKVF